MRQFFVLLAGLGLVAAIGSRASATIVTSGTVQSGPYTVPGAELNLGITPTVTGYIYEGYGTDWTTGPTSVLSNGTTGAGDMSDQTTQLVTVNSLMTVTYTFTGLETINSINTYSEWADNGRINQDYSILTSTDGIAFTPLTTVAYDTPGSSPLSPLDSHVSVTSDSGPLATGIKAVEFSFGFQENSWVGYTELSINAVPEPSSFILAGLGVIGLLAATGHRRRWCNRY